MKAKLEKFETKDFRIHLQRELVARCQKNPKYSLRAFAKALGIGSSALSDILNNRRNLTEQMKVRLGFALGLTMDQLQKFNSVNGTIADHVEFQQIQLDTYAIISDWYHYAILELIRVKDFKADAKWIANALGITKSEVNFAVERLQRVGLLRVSDSGVWEDATVNGFATNINGQMTSSSAKKLQKQVLEKSIEALMQVPIEKRNHTSLTFAMNPKDLAWTAEEIKKFRRSIVLKLERNTQPTQVYQMSISLFPVTQIEEIKDENE